MKIPCSNCNQRLEIPEELAGQTIECPACNASLAVPTMAAPPPAPVQESAPQAATSKKSISSIPKWAIASIAGIAVVVVGLIMFSPDTAVKTDGESQRLPTEAKSLDTSIHKAAEKGDIETVQQHLDAGADVNTKDEDGFTLLTVAANYGSKEIVELLIFNGVDVNAKNDGGCTPLHYAETKEVAELLIAKGADVNANDKYGSTPLSAANAIANTEVAELLIANGAMGEEPSIPVPQLGSNPAVWAEAVEQAIADGADVNSQKNEAYGSENAPLHYAAEWGLTETIELLIANGANVNAQEKRGLTPLDFAKGKTAALLRKRGGMTRKQLKAAGK